MRKKSERIVVTTRAFSKNSFLKEELLKRFPNSKFNLEGKKLVGEELIDFVKDADGIIIGLEPINNEILKHCPKLKILAKYGVGLDNINIDDCRNNKVIIGWKGGVNKLSVAEMTLGFMLGLSRNLNVTSSQLKKGVWNKSGGFQLSGKTVGVIGVGNIGKELIRLLKPFSCKIMVNDVKNQSDYYKANGLLNSTKDEILSQADFVTVHTPLNREMNQFFNYKAFQKFKKDAYLINTARGGIVVQDDLKRALNEKLIAGAAIDVYNKEPPTDIEFLSLPNLISTPHIGGNSNEAVIEMGLSAIRHIQEYFETKKC